MVSILPGLAINSPNPAQRTPPAAFRQILASFLKQTNPGVPVAGIMPVAGKTPLAVTTDSSDMLYHVSGGFAVTTRTGQGAYIVGTVDSVDVPTAAAHSTLSRIDVIYIVQPDYELSETGDARIAVVIGTAASSPQAPAIPAGALRLGQKTIGPGVTNTSAGAAVSGRPAYTALGVVSIVASMITDQQNINAGKLDGKNFTVSKTGAPGGPAVGDVWIDYS